MSYYIANRLSFEEMERALGTRVSRINQGMAGHFRTVGLEMGIPKTRDRRRLEFYCVSDEDYHRLTHGSMASFLALKGNIEWRPLLSLRREDFERAFDQTAARYPRRMDRKTFRAYERDLLAALRPIIVKIQDDRPREPARRPALAANPFQTGDLLLCDYPYGVPREHRLPVANCRVARTTKAYVWLEWLCPRGHHNGLWSNSESASRVFAGVETWGDQRQQSGHGHRIPFLGNEDRMVWESKHHWGGRLVRHRWDKVRATRAPAGTPLAYVYHYEPRYD